MKYESWRDPDHYGLTFAPAFNIIKMKRQGLLDPQATLVYSCEADSWIEAMTKYHEAMGWEPYKPMEDP